MSWWPWHKSSECIVLDDNSDNKDEQTDVVDNKEEKTNPRYLLDLFEHSPYHSMK
jgi:hypothetical protein